MIFSSLGATRLRNCLTVAGFGRQVWSCIQRDATGRGRDKYTPFLSARLSCYFSTAADEFGALPNGGLSISLPAQQVQPTHRTHRTPPAAYVPGATHYHPTAPPHTQSTSYRA